MGFQVCDHEHLNNLQHDAYVNSVNHGFWEGEFNVGEKLALIHSEVSEALEAYRERYPINRNKYEFIDPLDGVTYILDKEDTQFDKKDYKPVGFPSELADIVIRVMDLAEHIGISLEEVIVEKMAYNKTRPIKHGGKLI